MTHIKKKYCFFSSMPRNRQEVIMYRQGRSLLSDGFEVYHVVSDDLQSEQIQGIYIIPSGYQTKNYWQRIFVAPYKIFKKLIELDADVYHTFSIDQLILCLFLKRRGKKVFFEMREEHPYTLFRKSTKPKWILCIIVWLMTKWMSYVLKRVDVITVLTYDCLDYLKSWGIDPEKVHLWGNFPEINKKYNLPLADYLKRENRIIYFGTIYSNSKQEVFLKAISEIANVHYLVAGKFNGNISNSYKQKVTNMPEWKDVEFIDGFEHEELKDIISRSTISNVVRDFSVYSKDSSGSFGIIKVFESMEAALPIICSDMPIYRDIMKEYKCGILVNPLDKDEIKNAIQYLITHKEEAWRMGQEGRRAVVEKYSWDSLSIKYLSIVDELVASKYDRNKVIFN